MFCRNCGSPLQPEMNVCPGCGVPRGLGNRHCPGCGAQVSELAVVCPNCQCPLGASVVQKSRVVAGLLAIFLGTLGIHHFYLGDNTTGVLQLALSTFGGLITCGVATYAVAIWTLVEGIFLLCGKTNEDAYGIPLKD